MAAIRSFRDLEVYKLARAESRNIFLFTRAFPQDERYALTSQMRRASRAVAAIWQHTGAMLNRMIDRAGDFCNAAQRRK
jgi:hypothetical protein